MKKTLNLSYIHNGVYKIIEKSDESMASLFFFITDGCSIDSFLEFLNNPKLDTFYGNISNLEKHNNLITISIDENIFPNLPTLTIISKQLVSFLSEWKQLANKSVKNIIITSENGNLELVAHD